jgi:alpha-galactosidase
VFLAHYGRAEEEGGVAKAVRLAVIGAGSATFSLGLVKDIILTPGLAGSEIVWMDINAERLEAIDRLARRYAEEMGADLRFDRTTDREAALRDSDFVISLADAKGHHHARRMREVTARHGYYYGGVDLGAFYNLRLMLDIARDMERICPRAWLIQSGNPVYEGCTLMTRETGTKIIGLCHGHYGVHEICKVLGLDPARVTWQAPGLNHQIWLNHFLYDGEPAYPLLDEWIATQGEEYWRTHVAERTHDTQMSRGTIAQYHLYGLMPIGDTPRTNSWWMHTDIGAKKYWFGEPFGGPDTEIARPFYVANLDKRLAEVARIAADPSASVAAFIGTDRTREQQVPIIDALTNNSGGFFQVNVPNRGALAGVPDDVVTELPAWIDATGVHPLRPTPLPKKIMLEQIWPKIIEMERELEAFKTGDRSMLLFNALTSPQTRSYEQAVAVLDDLLAMEGHEEMAAHFAGPRAEDSPALRVAAREAAQTAADD